MRNFFGAPSILESESRVCSATATQPETPPMDDNTRLILESLLVICNAIADVPEARGIIERTHATRCAGRGAAIAKRLREHDEATAKFGRPPPADPVYMLAEADRGRVRFVSAIDEARVSFDADTPVRDRVAAVALPAELLTVIEAARATVSTTKPSYGFGDVGDVVVSYLRREATADEAMQRLSGLADDYAHFNAQPKG